MIAGKCVAFSAVLLIMGLSVAAAHAFDGTYVGVSASSLGTQPRRAGGSFFDTSSVSGETRFL